MATTTVELDNLAAGDDVATDLISTRHFQQVKLVDGTVGSETPVGFGAGTEAAALRVTLPTDGTGVVTANLSATDNAVLDAIAVDTGVIAAAVGGVAVDDAAFTAASDDGVPIMGVVGLADVDSGDSGAVGMSVDRRLLVDTVAPVIWNASVDYGSPQTNATVKAAAGAGLKLYITDVIVSNGAVAGNITLLDGSGGTVLLELYPAINGGLTHSFRTPIPLTANTLLALTSTSCTTHSVTVTGYTAA